MMTDTDGTETAMESFKSLSALRRGKLRVCTRKMNELKTLMVVGSNVDKVDELHLEFQKALYQGCQTQFLEGQGPAEFSSNHN